MISNLNPSYQQFLDNLNQISNNMQTAVQQMSTGLKISQVSDAPDQISTLLQARAGLASTTQTLSDLGRQTTEVNTAEQSLASAVQLFEQVQTLGAEGATTSVTAAQDTTLSQQVGTIMQQLVGLSGTTVEGRYLFSGDSDQQPPYTIDLTQTDPVSAYLGSPSTRVAQSPDGSTFPIALTAQQIFDSPDPTTNVFTTLNNLRNALASGDPTAIQQAVGALPAADSYLNTQVAFYGTTQDNLTDATTYGNNLQTEQQTQIANLQDADLTSATLELTQTQTDQQAALTAEAQVPRTTLFNFLSGG
jgi:flagellar hook-associated protein 3 FlgL